MRFGDAEVMFASHSWPIWGNARIADYLAKQRDAYKYIHDQTLRLANTGATPREIAEQLELPSSLRPSFGNRGYYGTVRHNAKAVYQWYFGWYDANPANLDPLPPAEAGAKYVEFMGGAAAVLAKAQASFDAGDYRWAATVLDHLVFARARQRGGARAARALLRPARLPRRVGSVARRVPLGRVRAAPRRADRRQPALRRGAAPALHADRALLRRDGDAPRRPEADGVSLAVNFVFTDLGESYRLWIENAVLHHRKLEKGAKSRADVTVRLTKDFWLRLATGQAGIRDLVFSNDLDVDGSRTDLLRFFSLLDAPDPNFAIVRP